MIAAYLTAAAAAIALAVRAGLAAGRRRRLLP